MKEKRELINTYIRANVAPILVDFLEAKDIPNSVILPADISKAELVGHYEDINYCPPSWYKELMEDKDKFVIVIDQLDSIPQDEQSKFIEIIKYKQVSTFEIPEDYRIIITVKNKTEISEEIYSLIAIM